MLMSLLLVLPAAFGGTDPTNEPDVFQIDSIHLNPATFIVTLVINTPRTNLFYGLLAHDGPPDSNTTWQVVGEQTGTGSTATFLDDVSGTLTHTGRSYRGFVSMEPAAPPAQRILTRNEEFVPYPFMNTPVLSVNSSSSRVDRLILAYGESIYSNSVTWTIPSTSDGGIFRMYTSDGDPSNATVQVAPTLQEGVWSNISE